MCGIIGYVGVNRCKEFVLEGLSRLEYRGYDSAGFVCIDARHGHLSFTKTKGKLDVLKDKLEHDSHDGVIGMGHTRWATHGIADEVNAHPHFDCQKSVAVVHNGIIEGYTHIRTRLMDAGHEFYSSTDTEVVAHLLESILARQSDLKEAIIELVAELKGAYSFVFLLESHPDKLIVVRRKSPLVIGIGNEEMFVGSDPLVFTDRTQRALFVPDESFAILEKDNIELVSFSGKSLPVTVRHVENTFTETSKQGFAHYMLKEIYEQKQAIDRTVRFYQQLGSSAVADLKNKPLGALLVEDTIWDQLGISIDQVNKLERINLIAAGTSWHAARIAQFFFEDVCKIHTRVYLASEFCYMPLFPEKNAIYIFVSQSGETADTLEAMRMINRANLPTMVLTNVASSTMVQEAQGFLLMKAGVEMSVCSTKAFTCMLASLYWLSHKIALERGKISIEVMREAEEDLLVTAEILESMIETYKQRIINGLAQDYARYDRFIFLGRHIGYPFALEAALKLKEISYIFSQCYPSGELKHGPLALIDERTPVVLFSSLDDIIYQKIVSNAQEVKARNGHVLSFAFEGQKELMDLSDTVFIFPKVKPLLAPLAMSGLMQYFVYRITCVLGHPVDQPRNLAKSVTVE